MQFCDLESVNPYDLDLQSYASVIIQRNCWPLALSSCSSTLAIPYTSSRVSGILHCVLLRDLERL